MSRLLESSKEIREKLIAKNIYNNNDVYSESHAMHCQMVIDMVEVRLMVLSVLLMILIKEMNC